MLVFHRVKPSSRIRAFCNTLEKLIPSCKALSFNQTGMVNDFLTDLVFFAKSTLVEIKEVKVLASSSIVAGFEGEGRTSPYSNKPKA